MFALVEVCEHTDGKSAPGCVYLCMRDVFAKGEEY